MTKLSWKTLLFLSCLFFLPWDNSLNAAISAQSVEELTLEKAIKKAIAGNRDIQQQRLQVEIAELAYKDSWDRMYLPSVTLNASTVSSNTLWQIPGSAAREVGHDARSHGYPNSILGLNLGSYTLFNFWKDRIAYDKELINYELAQERYRTAERTLRFQVTLLYYRLKTEQEKEEAAKRSIEIARAIIDLVRSKLAAGKATETDISSSTVDFLNAKNEYNEIVRQLRNNRWDLNLMMGEPVDKDYHLRTELRYSRLQTGQEELLTLYKENAPTIKEATLALRGAEMDVELEQKKRLPLPTVSLSGVTVNYANGYYGQKTERTSTADVYGNVDISASISLTLPLLGPGGLFNSRLTQAARIRRDIGELNYQQVGIRDEVQIHNILTTIKQQEENLINIKQAFETSEGLLTGLVAQMTRGAVSRLELRDAVNQARSNEFDYKNSILDHLANKLELTRLVGLDRLPGDVY